MTIFEYPVSTPIYTATLPNPALGDVERISLSNVIGRTRTGAVLNSYDAGQPALSTLVWEFNRLTNAQKSSLLIFLNASAGDQIQVTDYNGNVFNAVISNNEKIFTTVRENCKNSTTIEILVVS